MREYKFMDNFGGVMIVKCKNDKDCLFCKNFKGSEKIQRAPGSRLRSESKKQIAGRT